LECAIRRRNRCCICDYRSIARRRTACRPRRLVQQPTPAAGGARRASWRGRRNFLHLAAGAAALPAVSRFARAQAYPTRPVRIIVPFPAGQATDTIARLMGQSMSERLGQSFVIENRTGAGGNIGTEAVVHAPSDGYTLLLAGLSSTFNATLYKRLNFDFVRDITPVASIGGGPYVMVVNPSVPAKTVPEFIVYAKANPGNLNMGSSGNGSVS